MQEYNEKNKIYDKMKGFEKDGFKTFFKNYLENNSNNTFSAEHVEMLQIPKAKEALEGLQKEESAIKLFKERITEGLDLISKQPKRRVTQGEGTVQKPMGAPAGQGGRGRARSLDDWPGKKA